MKTFDKLGLIVDGITTDTTTSTAAVKIDGLDIGESTYVCVFNVTDATGTDTDNYFTLQLEVSDSANGTFVPVGNGIQVPLAGGKFEVGFAAEQANKFFRVTATETGDGATVTYTAFISKI